MKHQAEPQIHKESHTAATKTAHLAADAARFASYSHPAPILRARAY